MPRGSFNKLCPICRTPLKRQRVYCSQECRNKYEEGAYIAAWIAGIESGHGSYGQLSDYVRQYIFRKVGEKCERCGWAEVNPVTGRIPVVIDHVDGNWGNTKETNLRVLCPNCDSLTPTYKALNRGKGHPMRRWKQSGKSAPYLI